MAYIDKEDFLSWAKKHFENSYSYQYRWAYQDIITQIRQMPSFEFNPNHPYKRGKWQLHKDGSATCSECGYYQKGVWDLENWQSYCGHCGADMREVIDWRREDDEG